MHVTLGMAAKRVIFGASVWMFGVNLNDMVCALLALLMLQVAVLKVIRVAMMFDGGMTTARTVLMFWLGIHRVSCF